MWLTFALLSPFCWALVHVGDSHCVQARFEKPWMGVTTSAFASLIVVPIIPFLAPFVHWTAPPPELILFAFLAGFLIQLSQALYFQALSYSEAGIVAAYWNTVPAILPVIAFSVFGRVFGLVQYAGIAVIVLASVWMCLLDGNRTARWQSLALMLLASALQVASLLLLDFVYSELAFAQGFLSMTAGIVFCGSLPLLLGAARNALWRNARGLLFSSPLLIGIEIANLLGLAASQKALELGEPSFVAAVESTLPAYCFLLSAAVCKVAPSWGDPGTFQQLGWKLICVGAMVVGVILLS